MFDIVLFEPEIPPNTGNIIRLAANIGCGLKLIEPLGFDIDDKRMRRAGLDYAEWSRIEMFSNWDHYLSDLQEKSPDARIFAISTKGTKFHHEVNYQSGDQLLLGPETRGLPATIRESLPVEQVIRIPMCANSRSLNLSNATAIISYEAWRQLNYIGSE